MAGLKIEVKIPAKKFNVSKINIDEILDIALKDIKRKTPIATGKLKRGIKKRKNSNGGEIYIDGKRNNEVGEYQHFGTRAHWIRPKRKGGVLAWKGRSGRMYFSKGHRVRGIRASHFFSLSATALRQIKNKIQFLKDNRRR